MTSNNIANRVFPARNLPGSAETWGREIENAIKRLDGGITIMSSGMGNLERGMSGQFATSAQHEAQIAYAESLADRARVSADGKSTVWRSPEQPEGTDHAVGDTWFDESDGNKIYTWDGEKWAEAVLGKEALSEQINDTIQGAVDEAQQAKAEATNALNKAFEAEGGVAGALDAIQDLDDELSPRITSAQQDANAAAQEAAQAKQDALTAINTSDQASQDAQDAWNEALLAMEAAVTGGGNLYPDPSFEFKGYGLYPVPTQYEIIESPLARNGTHVMRVISDGTGLQDLGQPSTYTPFTPPNANYLEALIMRTSATQTGVFGLRFQSTGDTTGASTAVSIDVSTLPLNEWVKVSTTYKSVTQGRTGMRAYPSRVSGNLEGLLIDSVKHLDVTSAQQAMEEAEAAQNAASSAQTSATEAMTAADGKTRIYRSTVSPSLTNNSTGKTGDVWWRYSNSNYTGPITGQWTRKSDAPDGWEPTQIESEVIANLTVDKLTVTGSAKFPTAVIDTLVGDQAFIGSLYTNRVIVDSEDFAPSPVAYESAWSFGSQARANTNATDPAGAIRITPGPGDVSTRGAYGPMRPVTPGMKIIAEYFISWYPPATSARSNGYMYWYDTNGAAITPSRTLISDDTVSTGQVSNTITVPDGAAYARFRVYSYEGEGGDRAFRNFNVRPQVGSVLIENGAITGDKVNATSVAAEIGEFIEVRASKVIGDTGAMNQAFIGQLVSDNGFVNSLYTNRVLVTPEELAPGPGGFDDVYRLTRCTIVHPTTAFASTQNGQGVLRFNGGTSSSGEARGPIMPVKAGQKYRIEAFISWYGSSTTGGYTELRAEWFDDPGGARLSYSIAARREDTTGGALHGGTVTAPAGARYSRFYIYTPNQSGAGEVAVFNISFKAQLGAVLIEDGAITGDKLAVNAITAGSAAIDESAITNAMIANLDAGKISTGTIDAARIAASSISAGKISGGDFGGKTFSGGIFTGSTFRTAASGARTVMDSGGISVFDSSGLLQTRLSGSIPTGMEVRNPYTNSMMPLATAAFGTQSVSKTTTSGVVTTNSNPWQWTQFGVDSDFYITHTAWTTSVEIRWGQVWAYNNVALGQFLVACRPTVNGNPIATGNGSTLYVSQQMSFPSSSEPVERRSANLNGSTIIKTVPGQTYTIRLQWCNGRFVSGSGPNGQTSVANRYITVIPVMD